MSSNVCYSQSLKLIIASYSPTEYQLMNIHDELNRTEAVRDHIITAVIAISVQIFNNNLRRMRNLFILLTNSLIFSVI